MFDRYKAHPLHMYMYCLPMMLIGAAFIAYEWEFLGILLSLLGLLIGLWVVVAGLVDQYVLYWDSIAEDARILDRTNNPEVWAAMGFSIPEKAVERWLPDPDLPTSTSLFQPPVSAAKMTQFADKILMGGSMAETTWGGKGKPMSSTEIRELKKALRLHKLIRAVNPKNHLLGDCLTAKGHKELLAYTSPGIKRLIESKKEVHHYNDHPPLSSTATPTLSEG